MTSKGRRKGRTENGPNRIRVFDRKQIATILGIAPAVVRNWSTGKPFKITPSVRAPGKRGAANLYRLEDVYLFGIANELVSGWLGPGIIEVLLENLPTDLSNNRGYLLWRLFGSTKPWEIVALPGPLRVQGTGRLLPGATLTCFFDYGGVLNKIDRRIAKLEKEGKLS